MKLRPDSNHGTNGCNLPNEDSPTHALLSWITIKNGNAKDTFNVTIYEWGSPGSGPIKINISLRGGTITIHKNMGFV